MGEAGEASPLFYVAVVVPVGADGDLFAGVSLGGAFVGFVGGVEVCHWLLVLGVAYCVVWFVSWSYFCPAVWSSCWIVVALSCSAGELMFSTVTQFGEFLSTGFSDRQATPLARTGM